MARPYGCDGDDCGFDGRSWECVEPCERLSGWGFGPVDPAEQAAREDGFGVSYRVPRQRGGVQ